MSVRLVYSNRTEQLLEALVDDVRAYRAAAGALAPVEVIVPNRAMAMWMTLGIARRLGIAGNIHTRFLKAAIDAMVAESDTDARLVDGDVLFGSVLSLLLDDEVLASPELAPVAAYVRAAGDERDATALRQVQLARRLAHLFEEYDYARAEMLAAWERGELTTDGHYADAEQWQAALWRRLVAGWEAAAAADGAGPWVRASQLGEVDGLFRGARPVFVFGIATMGAAFHRALAAVGQHTDVVIYAVHALGEECALDQGLAGLERSASPERLFEHWGRPSREELYALAETTAREIQWRGGVGSGGASLLHRIQAGIAGADAGAGSGGSWGADQSVRVLECPGVARECEIIADRIWALVQDDESLRFSDVAVVVPSSRQEEYLTGLAAAFGAAHGLPYHALSAALAGQSRVAQAANLLLALPFGELTRQQVLGVATHPAVLARWGDVDPAEWTRWADELGMIRGGDVSDHAGTYFEGHDIYSWDQGLRRLGFGALMSGAPSGIDAWVDLGAGVSEFSPEEHDSTASAGRFGLLLRSLIADARYAHQAELPIAAWASFLATYLSTYLSGGEEVDEDDRRDLLRALRVVHDLASLPLGERTVGYRVAYELACDALAGLRGARGEPGSRGVAIGTFATVRSIPYRVVFCAGMGEGVMPARPRADQLDLRGFERRVGDVDARARDRNLFLETVCAARQQLVLSYVARDELTGESLAASSLVEELLDLFAQRSGADDGRAALIDQFPLRRFEAPGVDPAGRGEQHARALGNAVRDHLGELGDLPEQDELARRLGEERWGELAEQLSIVELPERAAEAEVETIQVRLSQLRAFLECPLQGSVAFHLGLENDDDEEDVAMREDEPFELGYLESLMSLREVFAQTPAELDKLNAAFEARAAREFARSRRPAGVFDEVAREAQRDVLRTWQQTYGQNVAQGDAGALWQVQFGGADEHSAVAERRDPLVVELELPATEGGPPRQVRVELSGRTSWLSPSKGHTVVPAMRGFNPRKPESVARQMRDGLRAFLDMVVFAVDGSFAEHPHEFHVLLSHSGPVKCFHGQLERISAAAANGFLRDALTDLLAGVHDYRFPFEAAYLRLQSPDEPVWGHVHLAEEVAATRLGPIRDYTAYPIVSDEQAAELMQRRYAPMFDCLSAGGES